MTCCSWRGIAAAREMMGLKIWRRLGEPGIFDLPSLLLSKILSLVFFFPSSFVEIDRSSADVGEGDGFDLGFLVRVGGID